MRTRFIQFRRRILQGLATVLTTGLIFTACGDVTGPSGEFLLRYPADPGTRGATAFTFSEASTATIEFEWEAASGADRYEIVFWRAADIDSVSRHQVNFDEPTFSIAVSSPEVVYVSFNPNRNPPDERELAVVRHAPTHSEITALMQAAGLAADQTHYFVWTVYAEDSTRRWRSPENHRLSLEWQPSP